MTAPHIFTGDYYTRIAAFEDTYWWHIGMREIAAALVRAATKGTRVISALDAGCGTGATLRWLQDDIGASEVVGIDVAPEALDLCRRRGESLLALASVLALPFQDGSFDLVVCNDVLQHLPTNGGDLIALREMYRVVRPGGLVLIRANSRLGMGQDEKARDTDFQRYRLEELEAALTNAGFNVTAATYANVLPALYAMLKRRMAKLRTHHSTATVRLYEGLPLPERPSLPGWLNGTLLWLMRLEAALAARPGHRLGFGHTTFVIGRRSI